MLKTLLCWSLETTRTIILDWKICSRPPTVMVPGPLLPFAMKFVFGCIHLDRPAGLKVPFTRMRVSALRMNFTDSLLSVLPIATYVIPWRNCFLRMVSGTHLHFRCRLEQQPYWWQTG